MTLIHALTEGQLNKVTGGHTKPDNPIKPIPTRPENPLENL